MGDIRVKIDKVLFDPRVDASVVLLKELDGDRILPIWIGPPEALAIIMKLENVALGRPMTHDLLKSTIETLGGTVEWVKVRDLQEGTYLATIRVVHESKTLDIDSRPSDALALAVREEAPIFVADFVFEAAQNSSLGAKIDFDALDEDFLANLPDEVFGKYKM